MAQWVNPQRMTKTKLITTDVSKGLLGWALCTLRLAVREANAFFQMYKHTREENKKLRSESGHLCPPKARKPSFTNHPIRQASSQNTTSKSHRTIGATTKSSSSRAMLPYRWDFGMILTWRIWDLSPCQFTARSSWSKLASRWGSWKAFWRIFETSSTAEILAKVVGGSSNEAG